MIDSHSHIDHRFFDNDRADMLERAFQSGMEAIIIPAIDAERLDGVCALSASDPRIYCGLGIHPHHAHEVTDAVLARIESLAEQRLSDPALARVVAIGEIGLDYHYDFAPRDVQQSVFRRQIQLAKRLQLPIIVHNRESDDDLFRILHDEQDGSLRGVLHCFSSSPERANEAVALGLHVSFTGNITFKSNAALADSVAAVPSDRFMIETDAPYMTPVPFRGKRNEPAHVRLVAERIADIRSTSVETIVQQTSATAKRLFSLSAPLATVLMLTAAHVLVAALCVLSMAFGSLFTSSAYAQRDANGNAVTDPEDTEEPAPVLTNRFKKTLGIGGTVGTHVLVEYYKDGTNLTQSQSGRALGAELRYHFSDHLGIGALFLSTINETVTRPDPVTGIRPQQNPNYFQQVDLSLLWLINPNNPFVFHFAVGPTLLRNSFDAQPYTQALGGHGAFGVGINIKTPIGIFYPMGEIRVAFTAGLDETRRFPAPPVLRTISGYFFSEVRGGLMWYPF
jgi:TatD DNase family protein